MVEDFEPVVMIPTRGRVDRQPTYDALVASGVRAVLVCPESEAEAHRKRDRRTSVHPEDVRGTARKRAHLMHLHTSPRDVRCLMMDDDLSFCGYDADGKLRAFKPRENAEHAARIANAVRAVWSKCSSEHPQVGMAQRSGMNRLPRPWVYDARCCTVHCVHLPTFRDLDVTFNPHTAPKVFTMEDYYVTLALMEAGRGNALYTEVGVDQPPQSPGGLSGLRNLDTQRESAEYMAARFPEFVKVVEKDSGNWGGEFAGKKRANVVIQWKKAREAGRR